MPIVEGHSIRRVYFLTEVLNGNESKIKLSQTAIITHLNKTPIGRSGWNVFFSVDQCCLTDFSIAKAVERQGVEVVAA